jgi:hypothetical protein
MKRMIPLLLLALAGCVETKDEYTLNPDGTGKVKHEAVFHTVNLNMSNDNAKPSPEEEMKKAVREELEKAEGVEAWRDVAYQRDATGKVKFTATAYFRDLAALKLHNNGFKAAMFRPKWTNGTLELTSERKEPGNKKPVPQNAADLDQAVADARAQFQQMKPMLTGVLGTMKTDMSFRLPGTVTESSNLKRETDGVLRIQFNGAQLLAVMEKWMTDDAKLREQIKAGRDPVKSGPESDVAMNEQLFGEAKPIQAVVKVNTQPAFDFAGEVAAAKAAMPAIFKALGGAAPVAVAPAGSAELKSVKVGGVRWVKFEDRDRDIRPFNWSAGYTLSVIAELPGSVLNVTGGELTKAEADTGEDLLPAKEWDRKIHFPALSKDKATTIFEVKLESPSDAALGFKEITGRITYLVGEKTKKMELGFAELADGAQGKELGAKLKSIKASQWEKGTTNVELQLNARREVVKAVEVLDAAGQSLGATIGGHSGFDNQTTVTLNLKAAPPKDGKIVVEMYDELKKFDAPFVLKNISLLGQPLR